MARADRNRTVLKRGNLSHSNGREELQIRVERRSLAKNGACGLGGREIGVDCARYCPLTLGALAQWPFHI